jgi:ribosome-binding factor A
MADQQRSIKIAQKESQILKEFSQLYHEAALDNPKLLEVFINRAKLSPDKGSCTIFFYTPGGKEKFEEVLKTLILYKPSLRAALGKAIKSRYVPDLKFKFDETFEKQQRVENLIEELKDKGEL